MDDRKKMFISFASHAICFGLSLNLLYIFLYAYFNDYSIVVRVNDYGEAQFELILIPITIVFCIIGLWFAWRYLKKHFMNQK